MPCASLPRRITLGVEFGFGVLTSGVGVYVACVNASSGTELTGTLWLSAFAALGVLGALLVARAIPQDRSRPLIAGLLLAALAPTVLAYPLNVVLLIAAAVEAARAVRRRRQVAV